MKYLWAEWDRIEPWVFSKEEKLILLDFDGTLVPIADSPEEVKLNKKTREILKILSRQSIYHLAIISGRPLKELYSHIRLKNVLYAGNHGLEIKGSNFYLPPQAQKARQLRKYIKFLSRKLKMAFSCYPGVVVEDKGFSLSLHFRKLLKGQGTLFRQLVKFYQKKYKHNSLVWVTGKKVWEIYPNDYWCKGDMVLHLLKMFPKASPIAIGDDKSDHSMFRAINGHGLAIHVGRRPRFSGAGYYLESPYDVRVFLQKLCP